MRGIPGALPYPATDWDAYRMVYWRIKNYCRTAYRTECGSILPNDYWEANGYTTEAVDRWPREVDQERTEAIIWMTTTEKRSTETSPDAKSRDVAMRICKAAFREQRHTSITVSMTTYCEAYVLDMDQWHTPHTWCNWRILPPSDGHKRVTYKNRRLCRWKEQKLTSLPKVKTRRRWNDVEIERIGTPHTTVNHQAEQVRVVTGQRTTQKDDRSRRKIVCRYNETRTKLRIKSPINPNINSEMEVTLLPSHDGNRRSIWWRSCWRSNKFSKEGDSLAYTIKSYREVRSPPAGSQPRHPPTSLTRSRTAACRERNDKVNRMVNEADFERLLSNQDASTSQGWVPMTTGCKMYSTEHAEALHRAQTALARLNLVSITIFREAHMLHVDECDETIWLTAMTDAGSGSSRQCQVMSGGFTTVTNCDNDRGWDTRATGAVLDGMSDAVWVREWR